MTPLTERVLAGVPGPRLLWISAWAAIPWVNAILNLVLDFERKSGVWEQGATLVVLNYAALSFAVVVTLLGTRRLAARSDALRKATADVLAQTVETKPFREMNGVTPPLVAAAAVAFGFAAAALVADGWAAATVRGATWLVLGIAFCTFLWTYATLHVGLDRIGRERLAKDAPTADPELGLRPLGDAAFVALSLLLAWLIPVVLTGFSDVVGFVVGVALLAVALAAFFLSLLRLHRQMVAVKTREVAVARELYAAAYEPVRAMPTLETLAQQQPLLAAADALEKRARAIHDWPVDEATFARVLTIATSVTAITIGRLILDPLGF